MMMTTSTSPKIWTMIIWTLEVVEALNNSISWADSADRAMIVNMKALKNHKSKSWRGSLQEAELREGWPVVVNKDLRLVDHQQVANKVELILAIWDSKSNINSNSNMTMIKGQIQDLWIRDMAWITLIKIIKESTNFKDQWQERWINLQNMVEQCLSSMMRMRMIKLWTY